MRVPAISLALLLVASSAWPASLQLRWNECAGSPGATLVQSFACDANTGSEALVSTITLDTPFRAMIGAEIRLGAILDGGTIPPWWELGNGGCRLGAVAAVNARGAAWTGCASPWPPSALLVAFGAPDALTPGRVVLGGGIAVPEADSFTVAPSAGGLYLMTMTIAHTKSTGTGACDGCATRACIVLERVGLYSAYEPYPTVYYPVINDGVSSVTVLWQPTDPSDTCPLWVPARNRTWGQVKQLYR